MSLSGTTGVRSSNTSPGLGLGLHLSKRIAEYLGARLSFASAGDAGTEFVLELLGDTEA